jgi:hypothetical protein
MGSGSFQIDSDLGGLGVSYGQLLSAANSALYQPLDCFNPELVGMPRAVNRSIDDEDSESGNGSDDVLADGFGRIDGIRETPNPGKKGKHLCVLCPTCPQVSRSRVRLVAVSLERCSVLF